MESRPNAKRDRCNYAALSFAHRAFAAREIFFCAAALILNVFFGAATAVGFVEDPKIRPS